MSLQCCSSYACLKNWKGRLCSFFGERYIFTTVNNGHILIPLTPLKIREKWIAYFCKFIYSNSKLRFHEKVPDGTDVNFDAVRVDEAWAFQILSIWLDKKPTFLPIPGPNEALVLETYHDVPCAVVDEKISVHHDGREVLFNIPSNHYCPFVSRDEINACKTVKCCILEIAVLNSEDELEHELMLNTIYNDKYINNFKHIRPMTVYEIFKGGCWLTPFGHSTIIINGRFQLQSNKLVAAIDEKNEFEISIANALYRLCTCTEYSGYILKCCYGFHRVCVLHECFCCSCSLLRANFRHNRTPNVVSELCWKSEKQLCFHADCNASCNTTDIHNVTLSLLTADSTCFEHISDGLLTNILGHKSSQYKCETTTIPKTNKLCDVIVSERNIENENFALLNESNFKSDVGRNAPVAASPLKTVAITSVLGQYCMSSEVKETESDELSTQRNSTKSSSAGIIVHFRQETIDAAAEKKKIIEVPDHVDNIVTEISKTFVSNKSTSVTKLGEINSRKKESVKLDGQTKVSNMPNKSLIHADEHCLQNLTDVNDDEFNNVPSVAHIRLIISKPLHEVLETFKDNLFRAISDKYTKKNEIFCGGAKSIKVFDEFTALRAHGSEVLLPNDKIFELNSSQARNMLSKSSKKFSICYVKLMEPRFYFFNFKYFAFLGFYGKMPPVAKSIVQIIEVALTEQLQLYLNRTIESLLCKQRQGNYTKPQKAIDHEIPAKVSLKLDVQNLGCDLTVTDDKNKPVVKESSVNLSNIQKRVFLASNTHLLSQNETKPVKNIKREKCENGNASQRVSKTEDSCTRAKPKLVAKKSKVDKSDAVLCKILGSEESPIQSAHSAVAIQVRTMDNFVKQAVPEKPSRYFCQPSIPTRQSEQVLEVNHVENKNIPSLLNEIQEFQTMFLEHLLGSHISTSLLFSSNWLGKIQCFPKSSNMNTNVEHFVAVVKHLANCYVVAQAKNQNILIPCDKFCDYSNLLCGTRVFSTICISLSKPVKFSEHCVNYFAIIAYKTAGPTGSDELKNFVKSVPLKCTLKVIETVMNQLSDEYGNSAVSNIYSKLAKDFDDRNMPQYICRLHKLQSIYRNALSADGKEKLELKQKNSSFSTGVAEDDAFSTAKFNDIERLLHREKLVHKEFKNKSSSDKYHKLEFKANAQNENYFLKDIISNDILKTVVAIQKKRLPQCAGKTKNKLLCSASTVHICAEEFAVIRSHGCNVLLPHNKIFGVAKENIHQKLLNAHNRLSIMFVKLQTSLSYNDTIIEGFAVLGFFGQKPPVFRALSDVIEFAPKLYLMNLLEDEIKTFIGRENESKFKSDVGRNAPVAASPLKTVAITNVLGQNYMSSEVKETESDELSTQRNSTKSSSAGIIVHFRQETIDAAAEKKKIIEVPDHVDNIVTEISKTFVSNKSTSVTKLGEINSRKKESVKLDGQTKVSNMPNNSLIHADEHCLQNLTDVNDDEFNNVPSVAHIRLIISKPLHEVLETFKDNLFRAISDKYTKKNEIFCSGAKSIKVFDEFTALRAHGSEVLLPNDKIFELNSSQARNMLSKSSKEFSICYVKLMEPRFYFFNFKYFAFLGFYGKMPPVAKSIVQIIEVALTEQLQLYLNRTIESLLCKQRQGNCTKPQKAIDHEIPAKLDVQNLGCDLTVTDDKNKPVVKESSVNLSNIQKRAFLASNTHLLSQNETKQVKNIQREKCENGNASQRVSKTEDSCTRAKPKLVAKKSKVDKSDAVLCKILGTGVSPIQSAHPAIEIQSNPALKGKIWYPECKVGELVTSSGEKLMFTASQCYLYGVRLDKFELWHILVHDMPVDYEVCNVGGKKGIIAVYVGGDSSAMTLTVAQRKALVKEWCLMNGVADYLRDRLVDCVESSYLDLLPVFPDHDGRDTVII